MNIKIGLTCVWALGVLVGCGGSPRELTATQSSELSASTLVVGGDALSTVKGPGTQYGVVGLLAPGQRVRRGVYGATGPLWCTNTQGNSGAALATQDDGNLVVYGRAVQPVWQSNASRS